VGRGRKGRTCRFICSWQSSGWSSSRRQRLLMVPPSFSKQWPELLEKRPLPPHAGASSLRHPRAARCHPASACAVYAPARPRLHQPAPVEELLAAPPARASRSPRRPPEAPARRLPAPLPAPPPPPPPAARSSPRRRRLLERPARSPPPPRVGPALGDAAAPRVPARPRAGDRHATVASSRPLARAPAVGIVVCGRNQWIIKPAWMQPIIKCASIFK
jgi:hypothetical protein